MEMGYKLQAAPLMMVCGLAVVNVVWGNIIGYLAGIKWEWN